MPDAAGATFEGVKLSDLEAMDGATLDGALGRQMLGAGLARLLDACGSSETGGIAMRDVPSPGCRLLPRWRLTEAAGEVALLDAAGRVVPVPDPLDRLGADLIRLRGRRDGAVQVAGVNVWLTRVGEVLSRCEGVEEVAVRLGANGRPKAFLVPGREVEGGLARRADQSLRCGSPV